ncbi:MAG TPA: S-adenosylmethionine:tRNA ribosyltransferase-isomerase [Candidatus Xenobia bacterium]|jgi:S-adenosylmethionine:tRNA ribosyltransferase-isomerase
MMTFALPTELEAVAPRSRVRLMVTDLHGDLTMPFEALPLGPGDLLVVNDSATLPAAVETLDGALLHFASRPGGWLVERRQGTGTRFSVVGGTVSLGRPVTARLFEAEFDVDGPVLDWLYRVGRPVRYDYVPQTWPLSAYQTMFARRPGSSEMPSAGRPFTPELVARLQVASLTLHAGLSSPELHEPPQLEWYDVPAETLRRAQAARRVIAVGTTVVRALESAARGPLRGWTPLVVGPDTERRVVDGLLTGLHEPKATHLAMLEAFMAAPVLQRSYQRAIAEGFLWHEFGDMQLLLP